MKEKYVGKRNALKLVMFQKMKILVAKINIVILTMEYVTNPAKILMNVQEVILAMIPSVIKTVLIQKTVAATNFVMSNILRLHNILCRSTNISSYFLD